jgi:ATP-dependent Clp protease protease subunit
MPTFGKPTMTRGSNSSSKYQNNDASDDESTAEAAGGELNVEVHKNNIYFYEDITVESVLFLSHQISKMEKHLLKLSMDYQLETSPKIHLYIHSKGGDAFAGLSAMSVIKNCRVPVVCIADGIVASAATFLLLGATSGRWIRRNSCVLIHQIRTEFWGPYDELKDEMKNSKNLMKSIKRIYRQNSTMPKEIIEEIMSKEIYLSDRRCLEYGLVDKII